MDNISLFCHQGAHEGFLKINKRKPFVTITRGKPQMPSQEDYERRRQEQDGAQHHHPQMLRLAILLMELMLGDRLAAIYGSSGRLEAARHDSHPNSLWKFAQNLLQECQKRYSPRPCILKIAERCIQREPYLCLPGTDAEFDSYSDPDLLDQIHHHIIAPLEKHVLEEARYDPKCTDHTTIGSLTGEEPEDPIVSPEPLSPSIFRGLRAESFTSFDYAQRTLSKGDDEGVKYKLEDFAGSQPQQESAIIGWKDWLESLQDMRENLER
ncbi:hypothetical protein NW759_013602 [Fusarium solani]|nr:hypothetical protein NW759_013602 [Fusarium solani]